MEKLLFLSLFVSVFALSKIHHLEQPGCRLGHTAKEGDTFESLDLKLVNERGNLVSKDDLLLFNVGRPKSITAGDKICISHRHPEILMNWAYRVLDDKDPDLIQPHEIDPINYKKRQQKHYPGFPPTEEEENEE